MLTVLVVIGSAAATMAVWPSPSRGQERHATATTHWKWVAFRDVEVKAPVGWPFKYDAAVPECIRHPRDPKGPWAKGVPRTPYVMEGGDGRVVAAVLCLRKHRAGDPRPVFGQLPFALWKPYVKLGLARPDLKMPEGRNGTWTYRHWRLTRTTVGKVQISVLAPPRRPHLGTRVIASARRVTTTALGCDTASPVQSRPFMTPTGPPIPEPAAVEAVAICEYLRTPGRAGLEGSRRITGPAARRLVSAIRSAPAGGGPNAPSHCLPTEYGDRAIALRFFGTSTSTTPLADAYAYYDWCFGNGIVDSAHTWRLTKDDCAPLFAKPPITYWSGPGEVFPVCARKNA